MNQNRRPYQNPNQPNTVSNNMTLRAPRGSPPSQRLGPERVGRAAVPVHGMTARKTLNPH
jgi:hypothetical protein